MRLCALREKEVINLCAGKRLGYVADLVLDECCLQVEALIVPGPGRFCGFLGVEYEYVIPMEQVRKIGEDMILVELQEQRCIRRL